MLGIMESFTIAQKRKEKENSRWEGAKGDFPSMEAVLGAALHPDGTLQLTEGTS